MKFTYTVDDDYIIPETRFDYDYIEQRVTLAKVNDQGCLRTALNYLYNTDGCTNLIPERFKIAEKYLEKAEILLARWLKTRTNGKLRKAYGCNSLRKAREARYRCQNCGFPDVRTLHLDHVEGRIKSATFACLCANCHNVKSREKDWNGEKRYVITLS